MIVKSVRKISPGSDEAAVVIEGGGLNCQCFCQPCYLVVGQILRGQIFAFNTNNLIRSDEAIQRFEPQGRFAHRIAGELLSVKPAVVRVGGIDIRLDTTPPADLHIGDTVEFDCERLDIVD